MLFFVCKKSDYFRHFHLTIFQMMMGFFGYKFENWGGGGGHTMRVIFIDLRVGIGLRFSGISNAF